MKTVEGDLVASEGTRLAVVAGRFNGFVVEQLVAGCLDSLRRHGVNEEDITLVRVPGAWELPQVCRQLAGQGGVDAIIALGAVIRGATPHFDFVAGECAKGLASVAAESGIPVVFGVLTTDTIEQAIERAGTKAGNKGADAAATAIEMISLSRKLRR